MPVTNMPSQNVYAQLAGAQAYGMTQQVRDDQRFATQVNQRDRHFYDGMAAQQFENQQRMQAMAEADYRRAEIEQQQFVDRIATEQENTRWEYTQEDQRKLKQLDEDDKRIDRLAAEEGWDPQTIRDVKWQNYQRRTGIVPQAIPNKDPWAEYPVQQINGKKYRTVPGRNGVPEAVPEDPTELPPRLIAEKKLEAELKQQYEAPKLELQAVKEQAAAVKQSLSAAREMKMDAMKQLHEMKTAVRKNDVGGESPVYTPQEIEQFKLENADVLSGVVDVSTPDEATMLPPGTRFRTPDGRTKIRP